MDAQSALPEMPDFNSLTEVMERFKAVPYEQFQQELNAWFTRSLTQSQSAENLQNLENSGLGNLPALVSEIYHRAELLTALSEAKITTGNEKK